MKNIESIVRELKVKGLKNIKTLETKKEYKILFNLVSNCKDMDKIGYHVRSLVDNEIGWGGDWMIISK